MKINWKKLGVIITISAFISSFSAISVNAAEPSTYEQSLSEFEEINSFFKARIETGSLAECANNLVPVFDIEMLKFLAFMEENFRNKDANSVLMDVAFERYARFKINIQTEFNKISAKTSQEQLERTNTIEFNSYLKCAEISDAYIDLGKTQLLTYIKNNSGQKRTTALVEKYNAINGKMAEMNFSIAELKAYFLRFQNKLPGFVRSCFVK